MSYLVPPLANDSYVNLYAGKNIVCPLRKINSSLELAILRKVHWIPLLLRLASALREHPP